MFILYEIVFFLYCITYAPFLKLTGRWHEGFRQRLGRFTKEEEASLGGGKPVWIHAVSVGEVAAACRLVEQLRDKWPGIGIVCSVTTPAGHELAKKKLGHCATVFFSPVDLSSVTNQLVALVSPKLYVSIETEIWPNLFLSLHRHGVPIAIVNGRISDKSLGQYALVKGMLKRVLACVTLFVMQSETDAKRIKSLGAPEERIFVAGNIKFDDVPKAEDQRPQMLWDIDPNTPLWIVGSTHPGEEQIILDVYAILKKDFPQWQLVIAPRHIDRVGQIAQMVKSKGFVPLFFSQSRMVKPKAGDVIIVDTIGHLRSLYSAASLVFVGKSLCVGGGHNIIEPAFYGKAVVVGPHMQNFRDIVAVFKEAQGLVMVNGEKGLCEAVRDLMRDPAKREAIGKNAKSAIDKNQGAVAKIVQLISACL